MYGFCAAGKGRGYEIFGHGQGEGHAWYFILDLAGGSQFFNLFFQVSKSPLVISDKSLTSPESAFISTIVKIFADDYRIVKEQFHKWALVKPRVKAETHRTRGAVKSLWNLKIKEARLKRRHFRIPKHFQN
jgi:hypothetical protein